MAFINKIGKLLKHSAFRPVNIEFSASTPSIYHAIRSMSSARVFVGGVSYSTDDMSLREAFARYGEIIDARVILDRETGRSRGFGFVTFASSEDASSAVQGMDGQDLHGRRIRVNYATERSRPGFGGGGGFYGGGSGGYARSNYGGGDNSMNASYGSSGDSFRGGGNYGVQGSAGGSNYQFNENSGGEAGFGFGSSEVNRNSGLGDDDGQFGSNQNEESGIDDEDKLREKNDEPDDYAHTRH